MKLYLTGYKRIVYSRFGALLFKKLKIYRALRNCQRLRFSENIFSVYTPEGFFGLLRFALTKVTLSNLSRPHLLLTTLLQLSKIDSTTILELLATIFSESVKTKTYLLLQSSKQYFVHNSWFIRLIFYVQVCVIDQT